MPIVIFLYIYYKANLNGLVHMMVMMSAIQVDNHNVLNSIVFNSVTRYILYSLYVYSTDKVIQLQEINSRFYN